MQRIECNVLTGEVKLVELTDKEIADAQARTAAEAAANHPDVLAPKAVHAMDRLYFQYLFLLDNRTRALEGAPALTESQFREQMIALWKLINA